MELNRSDKNGKRYCQSCLITLVLKKILYLGSTLRVQIGKYMSCHCALEDVLPEIN